jgi:hypothetical protein
MDMKDPNAVLTMEELRLIGITALYMKGPLTLRYGTRIEGFTTELRTPDLIAMMEAYTGASTVPNTGVLQFVPFNQAIGFLHEFIPRFFAEIRNIICKNKTSSQSLGHTTTGTLAALATWVTHSFHAPEPLATGFAAGVLIMVTVAAKGAFCKMTQAEAAKMFSKPPQILTDIEKSAVKGSARQTKRKKK